LQDRAHNTLRIRENVVVPKPDHAPALAFEPNRASRIGQTLIVFAAISLDHQAVLGAGEVDNKPADRMLPTKLVALQSRSLRCAFAQLARATPPMSAFRVGGVLPKLRGLARHEARLHV
jgi:hypothetical protein